MASKGDADQARYDGLLLLAIGLAVLLDRLVLLFAFGFAYVSSDDLIPWLGASDYASGLFREPCYYGQNYGFMVESLVAVPLLWSGMPHHIALPLATTALALFPFFFFAFVLFRYGHSLSAAIFLLMPLLLPTEYAMLTSMPRGFVTGSVLTAPLAFAVVRNGTWYSVATLGFFGSWAFAMNANALVFVLPIALSTVLLNFRKPKLIGVLLLTCIPALVFQTWVRGYYADRPEQVVHRLWELSFSVQTLVSAFDNLDQFFGYLTPVLWSVGWASLPVLLYIAIRTWRTSPVWSVSLCAGLVFIILALGVNKVNDSMGTVFHTSVRMFLGIPLLLALAFHWLVQVVHHPLPYWRSIVLVLAVCAFGMKSAIQAPIASEHARNAYQGLVQVRHIGQLRDDCGRFSRLATAHGAQLIVLVPYWEIPVPQLEFNAYGCGLLETELPVTLLAKHDRRYWVYEQEHNRVRERILIHGGVQEVDANQYIAGLQVERLDERTVMVSTDALRVGEVLDRLGVKRARSAN